MAHVGTFWMIATFRSGIYIIYILNLNAFKKIPMGEEIDKNASLKSNNPLLEPSE